MDRKTVLHALGAVAGAGILLLYRELAASSSGGDVWLAGSSDGVYAARRDRRYHPPDDPGFGEAVHSLPNEVNAITAVPDNVYGELFEAV